MSTKDVYFIHQLALEVIVPNQKNPKSNGEWISELYYYIYTMKL